MVTHKSLCVAVTRCSTRGLSRGVSHVVCHFSAGVDPPNVPKTRFEVIRWEYFTETHIFLDNEFTNIRPLRGETEFRPFVCSLPLCLLPLSKLVSCGFQLPVLKRLFFFIRVHSVLTLSVVYRFSCYRFFTVVTTVPGNGAHKTSAFVFRFTTDAV